MFCGTTRSMNNAKQIYTYIYIQREFYSGPEMASCFLGGQPTDCAKGNPSHTRAHTQRQKIKGQLDGLCRSRRTTRIKRESVCHERVQNYECFLTPLAAGNTALQWTIHIDILLCFHFSIAVRFSFPSHFSVMLCKYG